MIMKYVLIGTIALGGLFVLILLIFLIKRLKYNKQMKHNRRERDKMLKENQETS